MKFKKIMLATFLLLAILTMGAVSAIDDNNCSLTAGDVSGLSQDLDDGAVSIDDGANANVGDVDEVTLDVTTDDSTTTVFGYLILTDTKNGNVYEANISSNSMRSSYMDPTPLNESLADTVDEIYSQLESIAEGYAGNNIITYKSDDISDVYMIDQWNNRTSSIYYNDDPEFEELIKNSDALKKAYKEAGEANRYKVLSGSYGLAWGYDFTIVAEFKSSSKASIIDNSADESCVKIEAMLILTNINTGEVFTENITVDKVNATLTNANTTELRNNVTETINQLLNLAKIHAGNNAITIKSQNVSDVVVLERFDNRTYEWFEDSYIQSRYLSIGGSYGTLWQCNITLMAEYAATTIDITNSTIALSKNVFTFNNNVQKPTISTIDGKALTEGVDYTVQWSNPSSKNAGTYVVTVIGKGAYTGMANANYEINKAANPLKVIAKTVKVKSSKLKKKSQTLKVSKVVKFTKKGQGTLTYKKVKGSKKIAINKKNGKVTVKKGLKKGTYKVKVKIKAAGNANYNASAFKTVTFKIIIK